MSNEEKKDKTQEGDLKDTLKEVEASLKEDETGFSESEGSFPENNKNPDDIEDKIEAAMAKIVIDTVGDTPIQSVDTDKRPPKTKGVAPKEDTPSREAPPRPQKHKSARPRPITYVPIDDEEMKLPEKLPGKKHKGLKVTGIAAAMVIVVAGCAYAGVSYYYSDKFFEGTTINGIDCSGKTAYEAEQALAGKVENYSIEIAARNLEPQVITGEQINYRYMSDGEVLKLLKQQKPYEWIKGFFEEKSYTASENISFDKEMLQNQVKELNCAKEENQVAPENAYVAFNNSQFEIVPETQGSKLKVKQAYKVLDEAVSGSQTAVDFGSDAEVYEKAEVTSDSPELQATVDAYNNFTKASITYTFGEQSVTLDGSTIKDWLQFDEKGQLVNDDASFQQHIADYVAQLAYDHDTVGTDREFYTTSGRTVYVYGSAYGWQIDQGAEIEQLTQEIRSGTQTVRDPVYSMTANSHGYNDIGDTYIEVDLSSQHMYYYQNGSIIFDSEIVSGNMSYDDRQTPSGIYTLYYKKSPDVLRGKLLENGKYEYEQPVTYWMPFNGGIGFHDADWQPYFGGDRYLSGGSHGCINMPPDNAAILYSIIEYNVPIVCFY
ncbi:MAG: peptidoglycan binding domain-containing protein [Eubacteriales bacterium]|nr:peptidoglycan binding domain-containing protein [Eubacteriales bacterium]